MSSIKLSLPFVLFFLTCLLIKGLSTNTSPLSIDKPISITFNRNHVYKTLQRSLVSQEASNDKILFDNNPSPTEEPANRMLPGGGGGGGGSPPPSTGSKCNNRGTWDGTYCQCQPGYFDSDCSSVGGLVSTALVSLKIPTSGHKYFYYPVVVSDSDIDMLFYLDKGNVFVDLCTQVNSATCFDSGNFTLSSTDTSEHVLIDQNYQNAVAGFMLIFQVQNKGSGTPTVFAQIQPTASSSKIFIIYVVIAIAGFLVVLFSLILVIRYKRRKWRIEQQAVLQAQGQDFNNQLGQALPNAPNIALLTKEELMHYFPKRKFERFTTSFPQSSCSICLDDFATDAHCRQLYCEHIFHSQCIGSWLHRHDNCPNCKKEMTKVAIEAFLESQPKKPDMKEPRILSPLSNSPAFNFEEQESLIEPGNTIKRQNPISVEIRPSRHYQLSELRLDANPGSRTIVQNQADQPDQAQHIDQRADLPN